MAKRNGAHEESQALDGSFGRIERRYLDDRTHSWLDGEVVTAYGIVSVSSQDGDDPHTRYDFAFRGRLHMRTEQRGRTERGLAIEATKFARRISGAK